MKPIIIASASVAAFALAGAAPALAQTMTSPQVYAGVGYTGLNPDGHGIGELTGRMGLKFNPYLGVEGEVGTGVSESHFTSSAGDRLTVREMPSAAGYLVGSYPVSPKFDILARIGYGSTNLKTEGGVVDRYNTSHSLNYGAGAEYFLDGKNGIRVDYTRRDFQEASAPKDTDTWSVGYVHRF